MSTSKTSILRKLVHAKELNSIWDVSKLQRVKKLTAWLHNDTQDQFFAY